jgi:probable HAF family extracellular repeat protein
LNASQKDGFLQRSRVTAPDRDGELDVPPGSCRSLQHRIGLTAALNVAVGYSYIPGKLQQAARFSPGSSAVTLQSPDNIRESRAYSINNNGEIVGTMWNTDGAPRAFVVEGDALVDLNERISADDRAHHYFTYATAINDKGKIVVMDERFGAAVLLEPIKAGE